ncbi:MAG: DUF6551 family protein [Methylocella sp.]
MQRQDEENVRKIVKAFNWCMFAPVVVSPIDGGNYAIIDGQHRTTGAWMCGVKSVPCQIIQADQRLQAECFGAINGAVTKVTSAARYKAMYTAGNPEAKRLDAIVKAANVDVIGYNISTKRMAANETIAIGAIMRSLEKYGDEVTRVTLQVIVASSDGEAGNLSCANIRAVSDVLGDHKEWLRHPNLFEAFKNLDLGDVRIKAQARLRRGVILGDLVQAEVVTHLSEWLDTPKGKMN